MLLKFKSNLDKIDNSISIDGLLYAEDINTIMDTVEDIDDRGGDGVGDIILNSISDKSPKSLVGKTISHCNILTYDTDPTLSYQGEVPTNETLINYGFQTVIIDIGNQTRSISIPIRMDIGYGRKNVVDYDNNPIPLNQLKYKSMYMVKYDNVNDNYTLIYMGGSVKEFNIEDNIVEKYGVDNIVSNSNNKAVIKSNYDYSFMDTINGNNALELKLTDGVDRLTNKISFRVMISFSNNTGVINVLDLYINIDAYTNTPNNNKITFVSKGISNNDYPPLCIIKKGSPNSILITSKDMLGLTRVDVVVTDIFNVEESKVGDIGNVVDFIFSSGMVNVDKPSLLSNFSTSNKFSFTNNMITYDCYPLDNVSNSLYLKHSIRENDGFDITTKSEYSLETTTKGLTSIFNKLDDDTLFVMERQMDTGISKTYFRNSIDLVDDVPNFNNIPITHYDKNTLIGDTNPNNDYNSYQGLYDFIMSVVDALNNSDIIDSNSFTEVNGDGLVVHKADTNSPNNDIKEILTVGEAYDLYLAYDGDYKDSVLVEYANLLDTDVANYGDGYNYSPSTINAFNNTTNEVIVKRGLVEYDVNNPTSTPPGESTLYIIENIGVEETGEVGYQVAIAVSSPGCFYRNYTINESVLDRTYGDWVKVDNNQKVRVSGQQIEDSDSLYKHKDGHIYKKVKGVDGDYIVRESEDLDRPLYIINGNNSMDDDELLSINNIPLTTISDVNEQTTVSGDKYTSEHLLMKANKNSLRGLHKYTYPLSSNTHNTLYINLEDGKTYGVGHNINNNMGIDSADSYNIEPVEVYVNYDLTKLTSIYNGKNRIMELDTNTYIKTGANKIDSLDTVSLLTLDADRLYGSGESLMILKDKLFYTNIVNDKEYGLEHNVLTSKGHLLDIKFEEFEDIIMKDNGLIIKGGDSYIVGKEWGNWIIGNNNSATNNKTLVSYDIDYYFKPNNIRPIGFQYGSIVTVNGEHIINSDASVNNSYSFSNEVYRNDNLANMLSVMQVSPYFPNKYSELETIKQVGNKCLWSFNEVSFTLGDIDQNNLQELGTNTGLKSGYYYINEVFNSLYTKNILKGIRLEKSLT